MAALASSLTAAQIEAETAAARAAVAAGAAKLAKLTGASAAALVTPAQRAAARATLERFRKAWVERKRMVVDLVGSMAEALDKKPAALCEDMGVETDEAAGVNVRDFAVA